jgi:hypothetical protein
MKPTRSLRGRIRRFHLFVLIDNDPYPKNKSSPLQSAEMNGLPAIHYSRSPIQELPKDYFL